MMQLLLGSVSASALSSGGGGGGGTIGVQFDAAKAGSGHTLSNDDRTLINTSGGTDYRRWVPATKKLPGNHLTPFYWEFECNPAGPSQFNGYHGVVEQAQLDDPSRTYDSGNNPISHGSICYQGNGAVWGNSSSNLGSYTAYGAGDVVMIAFDPVSGGLWIGLNGTWENDPDTDPPVEKSNAAANDFWPVGQGREPDEGGTLRSLPGQFSYAVPTSCIALGESLGIADGVAAQEAERWIEAGGAAALSTARAEVWHDMGGGERLGAGNVELWHDLGGGEAASAASHELWIERT